MLPSFKPNYFKIDEGKYKYYLRESASYYSTRFKKWVHIETGFKSDGATGAKDLPESWSWWFHDQLCDECAWADGSPCTAWQASLVLHDILEEEGRHLRKYTWKWMTFLCGSWRIKRRVGWR